MRSVVTMLASTALAGALLGGCGDGGMFDKRASTAQPSMAAASQRQEQPSADIRQSQQQLQRLGYYDGPVDGLWGPETQSAVERYQRERGLTTTGRMDQETRDSLSQTASGGGASAGSQDRMANSGSMTQGSGSQSSGSQTADATDREYIGQQRVGQRGMSQGSSGQSDDASRLQQISPAAGPGAGARSISPRNLSQEHVREVQQKLVDEGQYQGQVDGVWGSQSQRALVNFQTQNGLRADGIIGPRTANALGVDLQQFSANTGQRGMQGGSMDSGTGGSSSSPSVSPGGTASPDTSTSPGGAGSMSPGSTTPGGTEGGATTTPGGTNGSGTGTGGSPSR